jgi:hypothetical protein
VGLLRYRTRAREMAETPMARRGRRPLVVATLAASAIAVLPAAHAAALPGSPTEVAGVPGDGQVQVTWTAPAVDAASLAQYRVRYSSNGGETWARSVGTRSTATSYVVTGLTNGTSYVFQVRSDTSTTSWGWRTSTYAGSWSASSQPVTPTDGASATPSEPTPSPSESTPAPDPSPSESAPSGGWWVPSKGTTWQWQLTGTVDTTVNAAVFDIDGEDASAATVSALHAKGAKVICYFSAGSWEDWRNDANAFPASVKGNTLDGWPDEKWLDVRALDALLPIMDKRIADCKAKGFDAVEPDNVDGYSNSTGFPLTAAHQATYNRALADIAHTYGLGVALKNDPDQVSALQPYFDFAVAEECAKYNECTSYAPFTAAGKAVLHVEYAGTLTSFCPTTTPLGFSSMKKNLNLDAWRDPCP